MKSFIAALRNLVLPFGRTSGQRIILDGDNGTIKVYNASNVLIAEISPTADVVKVYGADGSFAGLDPDAPNSVSFGSAPGLVLSRPSGDVEPASATQYDDTFDHGLYLRSSAPVASGTPGEDFAFMQMIGRYSADPSIQLGASGPDSFISLNQTLFDLNGEVIGYAGGATHSYTPVVGGGGTFTSTRTGEWVRLGRLVWVRIFIDGTAVGSGGSTVTVSLPSEPDRTMAQALTFTATNVFSGGLIANGSAVVSPTGAGAQIDALRCTNNGASNQDQTIGGASLLATAEMTIQGWYLEA